MRVVAPWEREEELREQGIVRSIQEMLARHHGDAERLPEGRNSTIPTWNFG
jgi:hypothetical protein